MIPSQSTKVTYIGDGVTRVFPFNFHYISGSDVKVAIYEIATDTTTILTSDYYVDTVGNTVIYPGYVTGQAPALADQPAVLTSDYKLVIFRETPLTQEVDLGDKYPLNTLETMDDKAILIIQEIVEKLNRCVMASIGSSTSAQELIEQIHEDRLAVSADKATTGQYKNDAAASLAATLTAASNYINQATALLSDTLSSEQTALSYMGQTQSYMQVAQNNANAAQNAANMVQGYAQSAGDNAAQAALSAGGSQHWAQLAYEYTDQLRHALGNMFEYDANADIQLVEDPLVGTDPSWEIDSNNDVMPVAV